MLDRERSSDALGFGSKKHRGTRQPKLSSIDRLPIDRLPIGLLRVESLEPRVMLSTTNTSPPTTNLHDLTNGPFANAGASLLSVYLAYKSAQSANKLPSFDKAFAKTAVGQALDISEYSVGVTVRGTGSIKAIEKQLRADGMTIRSASSGDHAVSGYLPIGKLHDVAGQTGVVSINAIEKPIVNSQGIATNQAETALSAAATRTLYGVNGSGIKVGVISNSVGQVGNGLQDSIRTGDLPRTVQVLTDGEPGDDDEGRAILEQIYDIAPGAGLAFASGDGGQQAFADAVTALKNAGCKVIIDDITYPDEPYFQPGVIDDAINTAVAQGVSYFSAAGNFANGGFLQAANFVSGLTPAGTNGYLINFNPNGVPATQMTITVANAGDITLEWDDAYNGVSATVESDLDIYLFNAAGTSIRYSGASNNFATGAPVENIFSVAAGTYRVEIVAKNTPTVELPRYYEFVGTVDGGGDVISTVQYSGIRTSITGHAGGANDISIGAVAYYDVPTPENAGTLIPTEDFSSTGPVIHDRDANGTLLASAVTLNKPDVSATDGNDTSFFGDPITQDGNTLPNFFGTSSASGNAAGIAALLLQLSPNMTASQLVALLKSTAVPVNAQAPGSYDPAGGSGLIDTQLAAAGIVSGIVAPTATFVPVSPNPTTTAVDTIEVQFSQAVTGVDISDFTFSRDGGANLLTSAQTVTTTDNIHYFISNLSVLDAALGTYTIILHAANSGIMTSVGLSLAQDASTSFTKIKLIKFAAAPSNLTALGISVGSIRLKFRDNSNNETSFVVQRSNNSTFTSHVKSFTLPANTTSYTDGGLATATRYYYRVYAVAPAGSSDFSNVANDFTFSRGEVVLDDAAPTGVTISGSWTSSTTTAGYYNSDYLQDDDTNKGHKFVTYTPTLAAYTDYFVYALFPQDTDRSAAVPVSIYGKPGVLLAKVTLDEQGAASPARVLLGKFKLHSGTLSSVVISNKGTTGEVVADAFQFLPATAIAAAKTATAAVKTNAVSSSMTRNAVAEQKKIASADASLKSIVD